MLQPQTAQMLTIIFSKKGFSWESPISTAKFISATINSSKIKKIKKKINNLNRAALSSVNHRLDLQHNCAPFQFTHGFTPDKNEENIDIVSSSSYKLNIDKHMRQHLEAEERVISSLIYIRELHDGN